MTANVLDPSGLRRSQLVLHLHRFDDDNRLAGGDLVARRDEYPDHAPGHRRDDRLRAFGLAGGIAPVAASPAAIDEGGR